MAPSDRREFLQGLVGAALLGTGCGKALQASTRSSASLAEDGLRRHAEARGLFYGAATGNRRLKEDKAFADTFVRECGLLVPESELKWQVLRPAADRFDFANSDWMVDFATQHGLLVRGHTLVWSQRLPAWLTENAGTANPEQGLINHIQTVMRRYAGKMHSWDVVNEALEPTDHLPNSLRKSLWLDKVGPDYIDLAFRTAAQADPKALLVYNENHLDYDVRPDEVKRQATLELLSRLRTAGSPVQALGIQAHLRSDENRFDPKKLRDFLAQVAKLGLKIIISELDVADASLPADITTRDQAVAAQYSAYLAAALDEPAVTGVITWGLSDRYTWLSEYRPRPDKLPVRPLPLDADLKHKPAWDAVAKAFDAAPKR